MKTLLTIFISGLISLTTFGQFVTPDVVASAGDHFTGTEAQLSWTIGEPLVDTYINGNEQVTQGFHQTHLTITVIIDHNDKDFNAKVYPNPVRYTLNIDLDEPANGLQVILRDALGKPVLREEFNGLSRIRLDFNNYSPGVYYLHLINNDMTFSRLYKIVKIKT